MAAGRHRVRAHVATWCVAACLLAALASLAAQPSAAASATSSSTIGATILSSTSLDQSACSASSATQFGNVPVSTKVSTDTGAGICRVTFGSTNASASLRIRQADGSGSAMEQWSSPTGRAAEPGVNALEAYSATDVYLSAAGGMFRYTHDGGATWTSPTTPPGTTGISYICFVDASTIYAASTNRIYRSNDSGANFAMVYDPPNAISDVACGGLGTGGDDVVAATDVGNVYTFDGSTWAQTGNFPARTPRSIAIVDANTVAIVGLDATLLHSTDAGATWNDYWLGHGISGGHNVREIDLDPSGTTLWARGADGGGTNLTWSSVDGGVTWTINAAAGQAGDVDLEVDTFGGLWTGGTNPRRSGDGGTTWVEVEPDTADSVASITRSGGTIWFAQSGGLVLKGTSGDGGATWDWSNAGPIAANGLRGPALQDVDADPDTATILTVGDRGTIERSTDDGTTWTTVHEDADTVLWAIDRLDATHLVAVGDRGWIVTSGDNGATWTRRASGVTSSDLKDVAVGPGSRLWAVGSGGVVVTSLDGGTTWAVATLAGLPVVDFVFVEAPSDGSLWITAKDDVYLRRPDESAMTLVHDFSGTQLREFVAFDTDHAVEALATNLISATSNGGASWPGAVGPADPIAFDAVDTNRFVVSGGGAFLRRSFDAGATWDTGSGGAYANRTAARIEDMNHVVVVGERGYVQRMSVSSTVSQYTGVAPTSWAAATGPSASLFAGCLQSTTGTPVGTWLDDPDTCATVDTDPWNDIPTSAETVATLAAPGTATADFVWGLRTASNQPVGTYYADVRFEVVAP